MSSKESPGSNDPHPSTSAQPSTSDGQPEPLSQDVFAANVVDFFRTRVGESPEVRSQDLSEHVQLSLRVFQEYVDKEDYAETYLEVLFSLFEKYRINPNILVRRTLIVFLSRKLKKHIPRFRNVPLMSTQQVLFPEEGCSQNDSPNRGRVPQGPFPFFYLLVNSDMTRRFVRYGNEIRIEDNTQKLAGKIHHLRKLVIGHLPTRFEGAHWEFRALTRSYTVYQTRRLYFVLCPLHFILQKEHENFADKFPEYIKNFKFLFKVITEPFIKLSEISKFLDLTVTGENKERDIEDFCKEVQQYLPKSTGPLTPRPLKHLCRVRMRKLLQLDASLPHGVWSLDIPEDLKNYLLLQKSEDEFYPRYVSYFSARKRSFPADQVSKRQKT